MIFTQRADHVTVSHRLPRSEAAAHEDRTGPRLRSAARRRRVWPPRTRHGVDGADQGFPVPGGGHLATSDLAGIIGGGRREPVGRHPSASISGPSTGQTSVWRQACKGMPSAVVSATVTPPRASAEALALPAPGLRHLHSLSKRASRGHQAPLHNAIVLTRRCLPDR